MQTQTDIKLAAVPLASFKRENSMSKPRIEKDITLSDRPKAEAYSDVMFFHLAKSFL